MQSKLITKPSLKLVGLSTRTNNKNEMNPETAKIGPLATKFWSDNIASQIQNRLHAGVTLSVYTDYESDEHGDYTYFIGEEVSSFDEVPPHLATLTIPDAKYQTFTTLPGRMPGVVIEAWQKIWNMTPQDFGGKRAYLADFEIYDHRAMDMQHAIVDICIGIKSDA